MGRPQHICTLPCVYPTVFFVSLVCTLRLFSRSRTVHSSFSCNPMLGVAANKGFGGGLFAVIRKSDLTDETLDALWEVFGWSINVLLWERCQVEGRYVAEGWRGSLIQIRGDWDFLCSVFRFPERSWQYVLDVQCVERSRSSPLDGC